MWDLTGFLINHGVIGIYSHQPQHRATLLSNPLTVNSLQEPHWFLPVWFTHLCFPPVTRGPNNGNALKQISLNETLPWIPNHLHSQEGKITNPSNKEILLLCGLSDVESFAHFQQTAYSRGEQAMVRWGWAFSVCFSLEFCSSVTGRGWTDARGRAEVQGCQVLGLHHRACDVSLTSDRHWREINI